MTICLEWWQCLLTANCTELSDVVESSCLLQRLGGGSPSHTVEGVHREDTAEVTRVT